MRVRLHEEGSDGIKDRAAFGRFGEFEQRIHDEQFVRGILAEALKFQFWSQRHRVRRIYF